MAAVGAHLTSFQRNAAVDNEEYGIAAFDSNSTTMADNVVSGSGKAGPYIGDSAHANLTMTGNETLRNRYGIFLRDSQNGGTIACRPANDRTATSPPMRGYVRSIA